MKYYIINTTTLDPYEMSQGVYVVSANSRSEAKNTWIKKCKRRNETIVDIKTINSKKTKVIYEQSPTVQ